MMFLLLFQVLKFGSNFLDTIWGTIFKKFEEIKIILWIQTFEVIGSWITFLSTKFLKLVRGLLSLWVYG